MGTVTMTAVLLCCSQVAPDPGFLREAVVSAERIEYRYLETQPPLTGQITDKEMLVSLADCMRFGVRGVETGPPPGNGQVFVVRVISKAPKAAPHEFVLADRRVLYYGLQPRCSVVLDSSQLYKALLTEARKTTPEGKDESLSLSFVRALAIPPGEWWSATDVITASPDNRFLYLADGGRRALRAYLRRETTGLGSIVPRLQPAPGVPTHEDTTPERRQIVAAAMDVSPDNQFLYFVAKSLDAIRVVRCGGDTGLGSPVQALHADGMDWRSPVDIALSPDGRSAYVAASGSHQLLACARNPQDGRLTELQSTSCQAAPAAVEVSPDARHVYLLSSDGSLACYRRSDPDGRLEPVEFHRRSLESGFSLALSPDGKNVYVASLRYGIGIWSRDVQTGKLQFRQCVETESEASASPECACDIAVHPEGDRVYVVAQQAGSLTVFERTKPDGQLRHVQTLRDGLDAVEGMFGARSVAVTPDGRHVYVGSMRSLVVVFRTNDAEGLFPDIYD